MKKTILLLSVFMISVMVSAQGIEFKKESLADVMKLAKKEKKAIFIDVYTSWCGPCKHMSETIFTLESVGSLYNEKFFCVKLDAEKSEDGRMVAKKYNVTAYPTLLFINGDGELVYRFLGGRDEAGMAKEAEGAEKAYNAFPELKKLEKRYLKGERSKEFLNNYFIARNNSGIDCGQVLVEYLNLLSDDEIIDPENVKRLDKITVYDAALMSRLIELAIKTHEDGVMDRKQFSVLNKGIGKALGNVLSSAAKEDKEADFEDILTLKERFFTIKGNSNSVMNATLGGGNLYIPSELLRLDYYNSKKKTEKFVALMESYIAELEPITIKKKAEMDSMNKAFEDKLKQAREEGNDTEVKTINRTIGLIKAFGATDDYYISSTLINYIEKYSDLYSGTKDAAFETKIVDWYKLCSDMNVSCKSAHYVAERLITMGYKVEAKSILTEALANGQKSMGVDPTDVEKCNKIMETI